MFVQGILPFQAHHRLPGIPGRDRGIGRLILSDPSGKPFPVIKLISPARPGDQRIAVLLRMAVLWPGGIFKGSVSEHLRI